MRHRDHYHYPRSAHGQDARGIDVLKVGRGGGDKANRLLRPTWLLGHTIVSSRGSFSLMSREWSHDRILLIGIDERSSGKKSPSTRNLEDWLR